MPEPREHPGSLQQKQESPQLLARHLGAPILSSPCLAACPSSNIYSELAASTGAPASARLCFCAAREQMEELGRPLSKRSFLLIDREAGRFRQGGSPWWDSEEAENKRVHKLLPSKIAGGREPGPVILLGRAQTMQQCLSPTMLGEISFSACNCPSVHKSLMCAFRLSNFYFRRQANGK